MNLAADAPQWLAWLLALSLVMAAVEDAARLRISNYTCLAVLALALVAVALAGFSPSLWENGVNLAAVLVVGSFLFGRGILGGGDVNCLPRWPCGSTSVACSRFFQRPDRGGVLAVTVLTARMFTGTSTPIESPFSTRTPDPYGIAIAAGTLTSLLSCAPDEPCPVNREEWRQ